MPRPLQRVRLENGLKLDLNRLARRGFIEPGGYRGSGIRWTDNYTCEEIAAGFIVADMSASEGPHGWLRIQLGGLDQRIHLVAYPRHYGGQQWYFICPHMNCRVSVLWMPPGANAFASRQRWGRQVAYASQFCDRINRAHRGKARINARLCSIGGFDPEDWDFAPKPKWMRWHTYNRAEAKFDRYEEILNDGTAAFLSRLGGLI